ncbi:hypothetical protein ACJX0J_023232 [Zea mays]
MTGKTCIGTCDIEMHTHPFRIYLSDSGKSTTAYASIMSGFLSTLVIPQQLSDIKIQKIILSIARLLAWHHYFSLHYLSMLVVIWILHKIQWKIHYQKPLEYEAPSHFE